MGKCNFVKYQYLFTDIRCYLNETARLEGELQFHGAVKQLIDELERDNGGLQRNVMFITVFS